MKINVHYTPTADELARASFLFAEKKPFFFYTIIFINIFIALFFTIMVLAFFFVGLNAAQWFILIVCALWLFGRRSFHAWILYRRMKKSIVVGKPIAIEITLNGIVWSGEKIRPGQLSWDDIKSVIQAQNGFIIPTTFSRFLWLPIRGFDQSEDVDQLKARLKEKKITIKSYKKWRC